MRTKGFYLFVMMERKEGGKNNVNHYPLFIVWFRAGMGPETPLLPVFHLVFHDSCPLPRNHSFFSCPLLTTCLNQFILLLDHLESDCTPSVPPCTSLSAGSCGHESKLVLSYLLVQQSSHYYPLP